MKIEIKEHFKVLTPDGGKILYNALIDVYSYEVTMPLDADESIWIEVIDENYGE